VSKTVSIKDVAARAAVSVGTVSNALNQPDKVAPATLARVRQAIAELGFVRNETARQLRAGRSRTIGLVVLDVGNPFYTDLARGAESAADAAGLALMLCSSDERADKEQRYLSLLEEQRVHGVLLSPVDAGDETIAQMRRRGTPVVLVERTSRSKGQCSVSVNDRMGGRLAVEHLLAEGHRRIAFIGGPSSLAQVRERRSGAEQAVKTHPRAELLVLEARAPTAEHGREAGASLAELPRRRRPTAAFCANDLLALGVQQELARRDVGVPDDLALVGYDDIDFAAAAPVPLSSIRQPREELGRAAAELLLEEASGRPHRHRHVVFQPELVVRASSQRS
jgi:LacI family transcriptional regulator